MVSSWVGKMSISIAHRSFGIARSKRAGPYPGMSISCWRTSPRSPAFASASPTTTSGCDSAAPPASRRSSWRRNVRAQGRRGDSQSTATRRRTSSSLPLSRMACSITESRSSAERWRARSKEVRSRVVTRMPSNRSTTSAGWTAAVRYGTTHVAIVGLLAGGARTWIRWSRGMRRKPQSRPAVGPAIATSLRMRQTAAHRPSSSSSTLRDR